MKALKVFAGSSSYLNLGLDLCRYYVQVKSGPTSYKGEEARGASFNVQLNVSKSSMTNEWGDCSGQCLGSGSWHANELPEIA